MTGRIFFERYPHLLPFILDELQTFISINDTMIKSNVQAILLLLSRLYINYHFDGIDIAWKVVIKKIQSFCCLLKMNNIMTGVFLDKRVC